MSNLQPNCCLKFDFQKVDQHAGGKWLTAVQDIIRLRSIPSLNVGCFICIYAHLCVFVHGHCNRTTDSTCCHEPFISNWHTKLRLGVRPSSEPMLDHHLPERTRGLPWGRLRVRIRSIEKTWSWKFYPAAQNFTNRMLFRNTYIFKTISLLWKRYQLIHRSSIFSTIQRNNQQSARNTSYILQLCCALVRDLT